MSRKLTYEFVKQAFEDVGCTLLSTDYFNNHTKLNYICTKGHTHSITWNDFKNGYGCMTCAAISRSGEGSSQWKGGVSKSNLPLYNTYAAQLEKYLTVYKIIENDLELLGVNCTHCNNIFVPNVKAVKHKIDAINGRHLGEANLYCSDNCKQTCPTYGQILWPKTYRPYRISRPNQSAWSKLIKDRDASTCQRCGTTEGKMIAHHIDPVINNPIESLDLDNGITLCKKCHIHVHSQIGCTSEELKC